MGYSSSQDGPTLGEQKELQGSSTFDTFELLLLQMEFFFSVWSSIRCKQVLATHTLVGDLVWE